MNKDTIDMFDIEIIYKFNIHSGALLTATHILSISSKFYCNLMNFVILHWVALCKTKMCKLWNGLIKIKYKKMKRCSFLTKNNN